MDKVTKFDNIVNVIDVDDQPKNHTYLRRARGLVKDGRAEWVGEKTIRMLAPTVQSNPQTFAEYLAEKKKPQTYIDKQVGLFDTFNAMNVSIAEFLNHIERNGIKGDGVGRGSGALKAGRRMPLPC